MPVTDDATYLPIGDYALLSDCHSSALVSRNASIDWACLRRFDRGSTFARILDHDHGGFFAVCPRDHVERSSRRYVPDTMVLETMMTTASGTIVVTDAFAMHAGGAQRPRGQLLRMVRCTDGEVDVDITIAPRFDYGATRPWMRRHGDRRCSAVGGDDAVAFAATVELDLDVDAYLITAAASMATGDDVALCAVAQPAHALDVEAADAEDVAERLEETVRWWSEWSKATTVDGPHAELLARSALVLKSLTCAPTGAIIAAPTTSLPEIPGGAANWDYRYCWVRDATLALDALDGVGHHEVAQGFRTFIMRSAAGHGDELQIMYGPYGERRLPEQELDLEGWRRSAPVRVGNAAATQTQLDVYGHVLDAVGLWHERNHDIDRDEWRFLASLVEQAVDRWQQPDAGVWEQRGPPHHFVHSKVMAWVALDRGITLAEQHELGAVDVGRWSSIRGQIRHAIETRGVDADRGSFVRSFGSVALDASLLKLPLVGFVDANDERMVATTAAIERELMSDGFVRRYRTTAGDTVDGDDEGVFLLCSLWLVEVLALQGRLDDADELFERVAGVANDVGLLAEQCRPEDGELLGNFPQAFTHLGLIAADRRLRAARGDQQQEQGASP